MTPCRYGRLLPHTIIMNTPSFARRLFRSSQLFFAATGAAGSVVEVVRNAPVLFLFSATQIALHYCLLMAVGSRLKIGGRELYVASNANVGGPSTAAAMAKGKGWEDLVLPGILVGVAGYATGTLWGVALGTSVLKGMAR